MTLYVALSRTSSGSWRGSGLCLWMSFLFLKTALSSSLTNSATWCSLIRASMAGLVTWPVGGSYLVLLGSSSEI